MKSNQERLTGQRKTPTLAFWIRKFFFSKKTARGDMLYIYTGVKPCVVGNNRSFFKHLAK